MDNKIKGLLDIISGSILTGLAFYGYVQADTSIPKVKYTLSVVTVYALVYVLAHNRLEK